MRRILLTLLVLLLLTLPALAEGNPTLLGVEVDAGATVIDLRALTKVSKQQAQELSNALSNWPDAAEIDLRGVDVNRDGQALLLEAHPELQAIFDKMEGLMTDAEIADMNYQVEADGKDPEDVAKAFLQAKGLLN